MLGSSPPWTTAQGPPTSVFSLFLLYHNPELDSEPYRLLDLYPKRLIILFSSLSGFYLYLTQIPTDDLVNSWSRPKCLEL